MGNPESLTAAGIEHAGWPVRLKGTVNGTACSQRSKPGEWYTVSAGGGSVGMVGVSNRSCDSWNARISAAQRPAKTRSPKAR